METRDTRVVIETSRQRIAGTLHLPRDGYRSRISDFLNAADREFIALTDVEIAPLDGHAPPTRHEFVALARAQIVLAHEAP